MQCKKTHMLLPSSSENTLVGAQREMPQNLHYVVANEALLHLQWDARVSLLCYVFFLNTPESTGFCCFDYFGMEVGNLIYFVPFYTLIKQETLDHQASGCLLSFLGNMSFSRLFSSFLIACTQRYGLQEMPFSQHTLFSAAWAHRSCHRLVGILCWLFGLSRSLLS